MDGNTIHKKNSKRGILLIHGLTASTQEMVELSQFLASKNYTVHAPLLKGHNTSVSKLRKTTWRGWYDSVAQGYAKLEKSCNEITIIGQSVGATLALHLAANIKSKKLSGLVLLAPAIYYTNNLVHLTHYLKHVILYKKKNYAKYYPHRGTCFFDIVDDNELKKRIAYTSVPLESLTQALKLISTVKKELTRIKIPCLLIHSKNDHTINPTSTAYIQKRIKSKIKKTIYVHKSGHVLSVDVDKKRIYKEILTFVKSIPQ